MRRPYFVTPLVILSVLLPLKVHCGSRWGEFLSSPDAGSFAALSSDLASSPRVTKMEGWRLTETQKQQVQYGWKEICPKETLPTERQQDLLFRMIKDGNQWALRAGLLVSPCLDGGDLEDFNRSAGLFFDKHPRVFLQVAKERALSPLELDDMMTMLPLETTDKIGAKLVAIDKRLSILEAIHDPSLRDVAVPARDFLIAEKAELINTKAEVK